MDNTLFQMVVMSLTCIGFAGFFISCFMTHRHRLELTGWVYSSYARKKRMVQEWAVIIIFSLQILVFIGYTINNWLLYWKFIN